MTDTASDIDTDALLERLSISGYTILEGVVEAELLDRVREAMYRVQRRIHEEVGRQRLERAGELGVLRLMLKYDDVFRRLLEVPEILQVVDATVSPMAILHLQNGLLLPSLPPGAAPDVFQRRFHMDFPRILNRYLMSINVMLTIDEFTELNGGTILVPGTHQHAERPSESYLHEHQVAVVAPPGSLIVFDSTLWHAAGENLSGRDRLAINHQFTRSYVKQQVDYARALGEEVMLTQLPRTQQLLGWYTRVVTSLDEYYQPADRRLYRSEQG
ncbi:MAG: phytanoyl-CoA dioxygenase family protein [Solirubrobacteraceae bacterium]